MSDENKHILQRFVAGAPVEGDALARAVSEQALARSVVTEAFLRGLGSDEAVVRRRIARQTADMERLEGAIAAALERLAATDPDARMRDLCAAALARHRWTQPPRRQWRLRFPALRLETAIARDASSPWVLGHVQDRYDADSALGGAIEDDGHGGFAVVLHDLPDAYVDTHLALVRTAADDGRRTVLATAAEPVDERRIATFHLAGPDFDREAVVALVGAAELVVFDDA